VSFDEAVRAHAADLYRFAYWLARDRAQAEDIVQEALLRGWRAFGGVREPAAVKSWLFSIVRNEFYRARGGTPPFESLDERGLEVADERASLFGLELREAILALPPAYAEPLALQVLGGFSCAEIAALLDTSEGAVMTRLTRARQALRRLVQPARRGEAA
jgi:RNA polymerase sigma-70 factor (ECF subfamily)